MCGRTRGRQGRDDELSTARLFDHSMFAGWRLGGMQWRLLEQSISTSVEYSQSEAVQFRVNNAVARWFG